MPLHHRQPQRQRVRTHKLRRGTVCISPRFPAVRNLLVVLLIGVALAGCAEKGESASVKPTESTTTEVRTTTTSRDPDAKAIADGNVARCKDGGYSDNHDFAATCSGGDGIDKWLAPFGQCQDGAVIKMSAKATCKDNDGFKKLLPADYEPKAGKGDIAQCKDSTFSDDTDFAATCSSRGGVSKWLAPYGECRDGTVIKLSKKASCDKHDGFKAMLPLDYTPPTTTTTTSTTPPPPPPPPVTAPPTTAAPMTAPPPTEPPPTAPPSVYYANCSEVRAAGAAPIYRGQPGYSDRLDRDGDGVACE